MACATFWGPGQENRVYRECIYVSVLFSTRRVNLLAATRFENRRPLSVPKNPGRRVLYKTIHVTGNCRGRPFLGRQLFVVSKSKLSHYVQELQTRSQTPCLCKSHF